jgi:hypothetical protein
MLPTAGQLSRWLTWQVSSVVEAHGWGGACGRLQPQVPAARGERPAVDGGQHPDDIVHKLQPRIAKGVPMQQHATKWSVTLPLGILL